MKNINWEGVVKTDDTNEAAFYILCGANLKEISFSRVQPNQWSKRGYTTAYDLTLTGVNQHFIRLWKEHRAMVNVREFSNVRQKLKDKIHRAQKERL